MADVLAETADAGGEVRTDDDGLTYLATAEQQVQSTSACAFSSSPAGPNDEVWDCPEDAPPGSVFCEDHAEHLRRVRGLEE